MQRSASCIARHLALGLLAFCWGWTVSAQDVPANSGDDPVAAERAFRAVLAEQPGSLDAWRGLAGALAAQGRVEEAARIYADVGQGLLASGQHALAAEFLGNAVELVPGDAALQAFLGKARLFARDQPGAVEPLRRAVELGQADVTTRIYLAAALWETRRFDEAEAVYRGMLASGGQATVHHQLGRLLSWQGRDAEAVEHLEKARQLRLASADLDLDLGRALAATGDLDGALAAYRRAAERMPRSFKARYGLARVLLRLGDQEAAAAEMAIYQRLYDEERERTRREGVERARLDHGWRLIEEARFTEALEHFRDLAEEIGESVEVLGAMATAFSGLGEHGRAVEVLERAVSLDPERQDLRLKLAEERLAAGHS